MNEGRKRRCSGLHSVDCTLSPASIHAEPPHVQMLARHAQCKLQTCTQLLPACICNCGVLCMNEGRKRRCSGLHSVDCTLSPASIHAEPPHVQMLARHAQCKLQTCTQLLPAAICSCCSTHLLVLLSCIHLSNLELFMIKRMSAINRLINRVSAIITSCLMLARQLTDLSSFDLDLKSANGICSQKPPGIST